MFSLIRWLFVLLLCLGGIGLYRGWFAFSDPNRDPQNNKVNINVSVDTGRLGADAEKAEKFTETVAQRIKDHREKAKAQK